MILQALIAFLGTLAFSILFGAPRRHWFFCGLAGCIGWLVNSVLIGLGYSPVLASFFATLALTVFSRLFSFWRKAPITLFLVAGIFPLVPGAGVYFTANYLFLADFDAGIAKGVETLKFAGAIALGILTGLSLPKALFSWPRPRS